jgi:hypothetical protein
MPTYINLTQGLEHSLARTIDGARYLRIQSTHLEQNRLDLVAESISDDFLVNLALGNQVIVIDCGSRKHTGCSRAIWQGLTLVNEWAGHYWQASTLQWVDQYQHIAGLPAYRCVAEGLRKNDQFMNETARKKFRYAARYTTGPNIRLYGLFEPAKMDSVDGQVGLIAKLKETHKHE